MRALFVLAFLVLTIMFAIEVALIVDLWPSIVGSWRCRNIRSGLTTKHIQDALARKSKAEGRA